MRNSYIFSPLCATYSTFHPISICPFPSPPPLSSCLSSFPPPFALCATAHRMNPKCSYGVFTKSSDFSRSRGERRSVAVAVECGDISKAAFSCCYLTPPFPFPFFSIQPSSLLSSLHATVTLWCCGRMWGQRMGGGETIDRASILSGEMFPCDKAKPLLAESGPDLCCTLARTHFGQRHSRQGKQGQLEHMVLYGRSKKTLATKKCLTFSTFLKNWINLPVETR